MCLIPLVSILYILVLVQRCACVVSFDTTLKLHALFFEWELNSCIRTSVSLHVIAVNATLVHCTNPTREHSGCASLSERTDIRHNSTQSQNDSNIGAFSRCCLFQRDHCELLACLWEEVATMAPREARRAFCLLQQGCASKVRSECSQYFISQIGGLKSSRI